MLLSNRFQVFSDIMSDEEKKAEEEAAAAYLAALSEEDRQRLEIEAAQTRAKLKEINDECLKHCTSVRSITQRVSKVEKH